MKNMKKLLCAVMAATTVCSMSISAFAVGNTTTATATLGASGTTTPMTLDLDVPSTLTFTVDPFNTTKKGQVISSDVAITNYTKVPVKVMVTQCQGTVGAGSAPGAVAATLTSSQPAASTTAKQAQLFLRASGSLTAKLDTSSRYNAATATKAGDVIVTTAASTNALLVELGACADGTAATAKGSKIGITGFTTSNDKWTADDTFDVNVAFNFQMQPVA